MSFTFLGKNAAESPVKWELKHMFGSSPVTILEDKTRTANFAPITYDAAEIKNYITQILQLEAVACKDWLTNKVDRSVTGRVAKQQTVGALQLAYHRSCYGYRLFGEKRTSLLP